ncbi:glycosyltransferase [Terribacillus halophilus]|jgi:glycosyltransferase involved in cell wall biosynthesis|uniref:glycosyltransferase n=1 Tax=Terribacillus halophilus TaxID=361279 RepID=UPI00098413A6|nr:glycosyltransferase [Terribacillus halophilus]
MNVVYITSRLDKDHGGLTASLLNKARILDELKNLGSTILTFHLDQKFTEVKKEIAARYHLSNNIRIENINDFYRNRNQLHDNTKFSILEDDFLEVNISNTKCELYKDGIKVMEKVYKNGNITELLYFNPNNEMYKKETLDPDSYLYSRSFYLNGYISREVLYRKDQSVYLTREFDAANGKDTIKSIILFFSNGSYQRFTDFDAFKKYFVMEFVETPLTYLVGEARGLDSVILSIDNESVRKVFMTHSIHIRPGTDIIRAGNRPVLNNLNDIDSLVLLTEKQKKDVINRFGNRSNYYVIPHSIEEKEIKQKKSNNEVVLISRLHEEKNIEDAIKAFSIVSKKVHDAKLLIYGDGPHRTILDKLITDLKVKDNVILKGYSSNVDEVLQKADCSILTSNYEGFGLVVQESLANGTPVIAYDIKYGPSDMIHNGENGFLVEDKNVERLAEKITHYLNLSHDEKAMFQEKALQYIKDFTHEKFAEKWLQLFRDNEKKVSPYDVSIKLLDIKESNKYVYKVLVEIACKTERDVHPTIKGLFYLRSTLENKEKREYVALNAELTDSREGKKIYSVTFDAKSMQKNETYDFSIEVQDGTTYHNIRVGNKRDVKGDLSKISNRKVKPYFTEKHGNLSFKIN